MSRLASSLAMSKGTKGKIMRANIIQEIIKTERNYTKQLRDIVQVSVIIWDGGLYNCARRRNLDLGKLASSGSG